MKRGAVGKKASEAVTLHVRLDVQLHASAAAGNMNMVWLLLQNEHMLKLDIG
jgi:hypothetical protein